MIARAVESDTRHGNPSQEIEVGEQQEEPQGHLSGQWHDNCSKGENLSSIFDFSESLRHPDLHFSASSLAVQEKIDSKTKLNDRKKQLKPLR